MDKRTVRVLIFVVLGLAVLARPAAAHPGEGPDGQLWAHWSFDPLVLIGVGLAAVVNLRGWQALARRGSATHPLTLKKWAFSGGLALILLALLSPLDALAGQLFSAHMVQHTVLMLAAAPLLVLGAPPLVLLLGLPRGLQLWLGRTWNSIPGLRTFSRVGGVPVLVWLLHAAVLWGWHAPQLYSAAVMNENVHALQHLSFLAAALLFWWVTLRHFAAHAERRGAAVMYLFTTALQSGLLGALLTFTPYAWYQAYAGRTEAWGLSQLADQQLAGTIMWVPAGVVFLAAALIILKPWIETVQSGEGVVPEKELE